MAEIGDIVRLKSGGPDMIITHVLQGNSTRDKAAELRGFKKGDIICEWQQETPDGKTVTKMSTFKAVMLLDANGRALAAGGGKDDDDDDDDDDDF